MKINFLISILLIFFYCNCRHETVLKSRIQKTSLANNGMVVSANSFASEIGSKIMQNGGNAIDAAIAVQFALAVVYPEAGNIGGGGFMLIRLSSGLNYYLDFRETAPLMATEKMFLDSEGNVIENLSLSGHLASGVPGTVNGMVKAHEKFGRMSWQDLIEPAIELAEKGFPLTKRQAIKLNDHREVFRKVNTISPDYLVTKKWEEGNILIQKDLGETLKLIRDYKCDGFYNGKTAENILAEMKRGNGIISDEDLKSYRSKWRAPVIGNYKEYRIISIGPPTSGGIALLQLLKLVEPYQIDTMNWDGINYIHLLSEAEKRVFADRAEYLGDNDFYAVPIEELLDSLYLNNRMKGFTMEKITPDIVHGNFSGFGESKETTHFSVIDKDKNAVAITTTLNGAFGSNVIVSGSGFFLNNEMDDFSIKPGYPNLFGLIGSSANGIQPGKRMLSSMSPAIIEFKGNLFLVLGSPGGSMIITTVFQSIVNILDFKMPVQEALAAGRFHHQGIPDILYYEKDRIGSNSLEKLSKMNYRLQQVDQIGCVDAIIVRNNTLEGSADPRGDDSASGY